LPVKKRTWGGRANNWKKKSGSEGEKKKRGWKSQKGGGRGGYSRKLRGEKGPKDWGEREKGKQQREREADLKTTLKE